MVYLVHCDRVSIKNMVQALVGSPLCCGHKITAMVEVGWKVSTASRIEQSFSWKSWRQ